MSAACSILRSEAWAKKLVPVESDPAPAAGVLVTVRNEKSVVSGAHVVIETLEGKVLAEGDTDKAGCFTGDVTDAAVEAGVSVTAYAVGHGAVSLLENRAHRMTFELPMVPVDSYSILRGKLTGFDANNDKRKAMVGFVAKAMDITDVAELDTSSFVSPLKDQINVFGKRDIPSNLVLPNQIFPIYLIPIHVNKPGYRLPVIEGSSSRYFGATGVLGVEEAIGAIRAGDAWSLVNLFEIRKVGISRALDAPKSGQNMSIDVVSDVKVQEPMRFGVGRDLSAEATKRIAVALWQPEQGVFVPTDMKLIQCNQDRLTLNAIDRRSTKVLDVLVSADGSRYRCGWLSSSATAIPEAGLSADVTINSIEGTWMIRGGETAELMTAHLERQRTMSAGNKRFEDLWSVVGPRKTQLRLPAAAFQRLRAELVGKISHASIDLLQMAHTSYPGSDDLSVLEKVRKEIK